MMYLSELSEGRDNNFNLIRVLAALAVLITHSFSLATGSGHAEPLRTSLGITIGDIAVDVFFITSGFLVTASLLKRRSTIEFVWARVLRIYPALWVMLLITAFIICPLLSTESASSFFSSAVFVGYIAKAATLIFGVNYYLPGVFESNPWKGAVNGSLWTMPYELRMYAILAATWVIYKLAGSYRVKAFKATVLSIFIFSGTYIVLGYFKNSLPSTFELHITYRFQGLTFMFFTGALFFIFREKIRLSPNFFRAMMVILLISALNKHVFYVIYLLTIAYILFYLVYIPGGAIRNYNKMGDYSYGIYIYAFPVQQVVMHFIPGSSVYQLALFSGFATLLLAILSWHFIEKHALREKARIVEHTHNLLATISKYIYRKRFSD